ncbi:unnamed protein product [Urochloa decumbens]|uniref:Uncharacterized protein n=1 Tax=Urochloa decumbens TaxID=240449 RepID=A0ABC9B9T8_9POAL
MKMDEYRFLVKFPPNKKVESKVIGKDTFFYLKKDTVMASLRVWDGDIEPVGHLTEVLVVVKGVPPKWADWITIKEIASSLGKLLEVDWQTLFASFFTTIRVRINCKDPKCIPKERVVEMDDQLYILEYTVEGLEQDVSKNNGGDAGNGPDSDDEDDLLDDDHKEDKEPDLEEAQEGKQGDAGDKGSTGKQLGKGNGNSSQRSHSVKKAQDSLNCRWENRLLGEEVYIPNCVNLLKAMEIHDSDEDLDKPEEGAEEDDDMATFPEEWTQPDLNLFGRNNYSLEDKGKVELEEACIEEP